VRSLRSTAGAAARGLAAGIREYRCAGPTPDARREQSDFYDTVQTWGSAANSTSSTAVETLPTRGSPLVLVPRAHRAIGAERAGGGGGGGHLVLFRRATEFVTSRAQRRNDTRTGAKPLVGGNRRRTVRVERPHPGPVYVRPSWCRRDGRPCWKSRTQQLDRSSSLISPRRGCSARPGKRPPWGAGTA